MIQRTSTCSNSHLTPSSAFFKRWQSLQQEAISQHVPVISTENALFLRNLLQQLLPKYMLEIGSAIGVSSAWIGHTLQGWNGHLDTIDISLPNYEQVKINLNNLNIQNVHAYYGDALVWLNQRTVQASLNHYLYDCIFIDAHKIQSHSFYTACLPHLSPKGIIIIDDAWKFRHKMHMLYNLLTTHQQGYSLHFVDPQDATLVIQPK
jgi:predicted O-methyltransferase YrrM